MEKSTSTGSSGAEVDTNEYCSFHRRAMSLVIWAPLYFAMDFLDELIVNVVSECPVCIWSPGPEDGPVHSTKVGGTCPDVDDKRVRDHVKGVSATANGPEMIMAEFTEPAAASKIAVLST